MNDAEQPPNPSLKTLGNGKFVETDAANQRVILEFRPGPEHCHTGGVVQGGFVTGWVDAAMAHASFASGRRLGSMGTLEVKISFLLPAQPNTVYRAEGWVVRAGRSVVFMEGKLTDPDGKLVATGSSTGRWLEPIE
jgi:uncharacterized protein (TIGR00369 family)